LNNSNVRFPFANDNYVLVCNNYFKINKYKIKIEDIDGRNNQGRFKTSVIQPKNAKVYPLCDNYDNKTFPSEFVIDILLKRK